MDERQNIMMKRLEKLEDKEAENVYGLIFKPLDKHDFDSDGRHNVNYDDVIWSNGHYLYTASLEVLMEMEIIDTSKPIHNYFPEEDSCATFEVISGYSLLQWWERAAFGKITDSYFVNSYEFCTYEVDKENPVYAEYKFRSYRRMMQNMVRTYPKWEKIFQSCPEFWQETNV